MKRKVYIALMIVLGIICIVTFKLFDTEQENNWLYPVISGVLGFIFMFLSIKNQTQN
ncbi:MAG: hypothetical protein ABF257_10045 [Polaribacter sp.]|jgi:uncharacterized membrane protein HdeD (DUF308 family)|tara:strand:- start:1061 stop:1231 length:171 start_codon:yes stop_codon:yes gene_type:complete